jgi:5-methylcytosine-specific restriction enzyme A
VPAGARASRHHLTPRLKGGARRSTVLLHQICHNAIHARFSEAELARRLSDIPSLRAEPEIARFLDWVRTKPPGFHAPTRRSRGKNGPHRGRRA